ncbi:protein kinase [Gemmatimonadota bacterium]
MIGKTVGHYQILEKIGSGGMGEVWLANDTSLERKVALKFLPAEAVSEEEQTRFIREARAASALDHPNICTIYEVDETYTGQTYIAMAYCDGDTVRERIARDPMELDEVLDIAIQTAEGLARAHKEDIVHRDIKPANVIITQAGLAKIVDFGLAKLSGSTQLTRTGSSLGTAAYMSPEQVRGDEIDHRVDIWSFGVMLFEMVTGHLPFQGDNETTMMYSVLNEDPESLVSIREDIPRDLEDLVGKALVKDPATRYQTMQELIDDLKNVTGTGMEQQRDEKSIAVLPFTNMSADPENEYFSDGITEDIITQFTRIRDLTVISRTSVMQYKDTDKSLKAIGRELGVSTILEGSVRKAGNQVRIVAQLIDARSDKHLWAETYDRELEDIFAIQSEVAEQIAAALDIKLHADEQLALQTQPTENMEAYQAHMRSRYYLGLPHFTVENWEKGMAALEQAVELDPDFALAWAELSINHAKLVFLRTDASLERQELARLAAERAAELAPDSPEIHLALGLYHLWAYHDTRKAEEHLKIAERGLHGDARVPEAWAAVFEVEGQFEEAIECYKDTLKLSPNDAHCYTMITWNSYLIRKYEQAVEAGDQAIVLAPDQLWPYLFKFFALTFWKGSTSESRKVLEALPADIDWVAFVWHVQTFGEGRYQEAIDCLLPPSGDWFRLKTWAMPKVLLAAHAQVLLDQPQLARDSYDSARELLEPEVEAYPDDPRYHSSLGLAYAGLGRKEEAIREGKRGVELLPISKDASYGPCYESDLSYIYTMVGEPDLALDVIEHLLAIPSFYSIPWVLSWPGFISLRSHPRFKQLMNE